MVLCKISFSELCEALSKKDLKNHGNLGKLIKQGTSYDNDSFDSTIALDGLNKSAYLKEWR
jgi:hypothetical protein